MRQFQYCRRLIFVLVLLFAVAKAEDRQVAATQSDLDQARQTLKEMSKPKDREIWEKRVKVLEEEVRNLQRRADLEKKEQSILSRQQKSPYQALLETVATINIDGSETEKKRATVQQRLQVLGAQRKELEQQLSAPRPPDEPSTENQAEAEQQLKNLDAEIMSATFARDQCDLALKLALDAARLDQSLKQTLVHPRASLRLLIEKRRPLAVASANLNDYRLIAETLNAEKAQALERLAVARERSSQVGPELDNLKERYQIEKKSSVGTAADRDAKLERLNRLMSSTKSEARLLEPRIAHFAQQVATLDAALAAANQGVDLARKEIQYLAADYDAFRSEFTGKLSTLATVLALIVILQIVVTRVILPLSSAKEHLLLARRLTRYVTFLVMLAVTTSFFFEDIRSVATILGLATAAVVIALQDLCSSYVGWFVIATSRKVQVGDRIEIDGLVGDIIDIQLLRTTLLECNRWLGTDDHTGRVVFVPNNFIFKNHVFNYSHIHPFIWQKMDVTVTYESPPEKAHAVLMTVLEAEARECCGALQEGDAKLSKAYELISGDTAQPRILYTIADSGVQLTLFYPVHYRNASSMRSRLSQRILEELAKHPEIQLAYPTQRQIPTPLPEGFKVSAGKEWPVPSSSASAG